MADTDKDGKGFDNAIAAMLAEEFGDTLTYVWWPARRGFIRNTLRARECDLVIGVPTEYDPVLPTKPYYRSTYYLVTRADRKLDIKTLDDPRLKKLKIGVNLIGEDYEHTPPVLSAAISPDSLLLEAARRVLATRRARRPARPACCHMEAMVPG